MIRPLYDRVILKRDTPEQMSEGGLHLPPAAQNEQQTTGEVVAVGHGRLNPDGSTTALKVEVGMRVMFGKYSGTDVEHDGEKLVVLRESDILAIVVDSE